MNTAYIYAEQIEPVFVRLADYNLAILNKADIDGGGTTGGTWYQDTILSDLFPNYKQVIRVLGGQMAIEYGNVQLDVHRFVVTSVSGLKVKVGSAEYTVFHTGNFNPDSKANTDGSNASGALAAAIAMRHDAVTLGPNNIGLNLAGQILQLDSGFAIPTGNEIANWNALIANIGNYALNDGSNLTSPATWRTNLSLYSISQVNGLLSGKADLDGSNSTGNLADAISKRHDAVALGTPNGLSLANQVLSMALAGALSTGSLSAADWNNFNNKVSANNGNITYVGTGNITGGGTSSANQSANTNYSFDLTAQTKSDISLGVNAFNSLGNYQTKLTNGLHTILNGNKVDVAFDVNTYVKDKSNNDRLLFGNTASTDVVIKGAVANGDFRVEDNAGGLLFRVNGTNKVPYFPQLPAPQTGDSYLATFDAGNGLWKHSTRISDLVTTSVLNAGLATKANVNGNNLTNIPQWQSVLGINTSWNLQQVVQNGHITNLSAIFNGIEIGYQSGAYKGFNSSLDFSFLNGNNAGRVLIGGLLVSGSYNDASLVPTNGIYSKGTIATLSHYTSTEWATAYDIVVSLQNTIGNYALNNGSNITNISGWRSTLGVGLWGGYRLDPGAPINPTHSTLYDSSTGHFKTATLPEFSNWLGLSAYALAANILNGLLAFSVSTDFASGSFNFSANQGTNISPTLALSATIKNDISTGVAAFNSLGNYIPNNRTITFNGQTQFLNSSPNFTISVTPPPRTTENVTVSGGGTVPLKTRKTRVTIMDAGTYDIPKGTEDGDSLFVMFCESGGGDFGGQLNIKHMDKCTNIIDDMAFTSNKGYYFWWSRADDCWLGLLL